METLSQAVSIKSISADPELRNEVNKMMQWAQAKLKALGADVQLCDIGQQVIIQQFNISKKTGLNKELKIFSNQDLSLKNIVVWLFKLLNS